MLLPMQGVLLAASFPPGVARGYCDNAPYGAVISHFSPLTTHY